jgi:hypothetical protein
VADSNTLDSASSREPWSFVVATDPHLREDNPFRTPKGTEGMPALEKFRRVLEDAARLQPAPQFLMLLGDLHLEKFEPLLPEIPWPVHVIAGNHELTEDRARLRELFAADFQGRDFYTFEHNGSLFINMCNAVPGDHVGYFESQRITPNTGQLAWLETQLQRGRDFQHCILFGHVPPTPDGTPHRHHLSSNDALWLRRRVQQYQPSALFFGHRHQRICFQIADTPVYSLESCNWNFNPNEPVGFVHVTVFADRLEVEFIRTFG